MSKDDSFNNLLKKLERDNILNTETSSDLVITNYSGIRR